MLAISCGGGWLAGTPDVSYDVKPVAVLDFGCTPRGGWLGWIWGEVWLLPTGWRKLTGLKGVLVCPIPAFRGW